VTPGPPPKLICRILGRSRFATPSPLLSLFGDRSLLLPPQSNLYSPFFWGLVRCFFCQPCLFPSRPDRSPPLGFLSREVLSFLFSPWRGLRTLSVLVLTHVSIVRLSVSRITPSISLPPPFLGDFASLPAPFFHLKSFVFVSFSVWPCVGFFFPPLPSLPFQRW